MPLKDSLKVLTREQQRAVVRGLRSLHDVQPILDAAEDCGVDCSVHRQLAEALGQRLEALRRHFVGEDLR